MNSGDWGGTEDELADGRDAGDPLATLRAEIEDSANDFCSGMMEDFTMSLMHNETPPRPQGE